MTKVGENTEVGEVIEASALPPGADRSRRSPFFVIAAREAGAHIRGRRFALGAALTFVLCVLAAFIRTDDVGQAQRERALFLQRWPDSIREQLERHEVIEIENARAVSPLSTLSVGLEPVTPFRFTSTKEGLRFGETRGASNPLDILLGYLDVSFVVGTLLSLLCIAFTFDSISAERVRGTLAVLLSYPVARTTVYFAKVAANSLVAICCFLPALIAALFVVEVRGLPLLDLRHWLLYALFSIVYVAVFTAIGVGVSATGGQPADSALRGVFVWALLVFVVPRASGTLIQALRPAPRLTEIAVREDEALSRLRLDYSRRMTKAFDVYMSGQGARADRDTQFESERHDATRSLEINRRRVLTTAWDAQLREEERRDRWIRLLSILSPPALFQESAAELAWTGREQRRHFLAEARRYDETIGRRLAESREVYTTGSGSIQSAVVVHANVQPYLVPFRPTWAPSNAILRSLVVPMIALLSMLGIACWIATAALRRLDVRP